MRISCDTREHGLRSAVAWAVLVLFNLGLPIGTVITLYDSARSVQAPSTAKRQHQPNSAHDLQAATATSKQPRQGRRACVSRYTVVTQQALHFLSAEYKPEWKYWEAVLLLKKGALVALATLLANSAHSHQLCAWQCGADGAALRCNVCNV